MEYIKNSNQQGKNENENEDEEATTETSLPENIAREDYQLQHGEIPERIRESLKLIDENSPEGKKFQEILTNLVSELYSEEKRADVDLINTNEKELIIHDFKNNPIRFFLSDDETPNAAYLSSKPPCIILNRGLFTNNNGSKENTIIQNISDLIFVVCHEITHHRIELKLGEHQNSTLEESIAYTTPLLQLFMNGYDPSDAIATLERLIIHSKSNDEIISEFLDVHPFGNLKKEICTTYIAKLEQNYGSLEANIETSKNNLENNIVSDISACLSTHHISALEYFIEKRGEINTTTDKINCIREFLESSADSEIYPVRITDCRQYFLKLEINKESKDIRKAVSKLADKILEIMQHNSSNELGLFYKICCKSLSEKGDCLPIGKLGRLRKANNMFINSIESDSPWQNINDAARELVDAYKEIEASSGRLIDFFKTLKWKKFSNQKRSFTLFKRKLKDLQIYTEIESYYPSIIEAAFLTDIHKDNTVMAVLCINNELFLKYYFKKFSTILSPNTGYIGKFEKTLTEKFNLMINEIFNNPILDVEETKKIIRLYQFHFEVKILDPHNFDNRINMMKKNPELYFEIFKSYYVKKQGVISLLVDLKYMEKDDRESYIKLIKFIYNLDHQTESIAPLSAFYSNSKYNISLTSGDYLYYDFLEKINDKKIISEDDKKNVLFKITELSLSHCEALDNLSEKELKYIYRSATSLLGIQHEELEQYSYEQINELLINIQSAPFSKNKKDFLQKFSYILFFEHYTKDKNVPYNFLIAYSKEIMRYCGKTQIEFIQNNQEFLNKVFFENCKNKRIEGLISDFITLNNAELVSENLKRKIGEHIITELKSMSADGNYDRVMEICKNLFMAKAFESIRINNQIIDIFAEAFLSKYGIDDGSIEYYKKIEDVINNHFQGKRITGQIKYQLYERVASKIEAQKELSFFFENKLNILNKDYFGNSIIYGRLFNYIYSVLKKDPQSERRIATINYLLSKGERGDAIVFLGYFEDYYRKNYFDDFEILTRDESYNRNKDIQKCLLLYENFQEVSLPEKAVFIKFLLSDKNGNIPNEIFHTILDKIFSSDIPYGQVCKDLLKTHISYYGEYYRDLLFSALLTANDSKDNGVHSAGELFVLFAENMGPAYIKVMQGIEGNAAIPLDLRNDISQHARRLKFDGARPTRWELWHCLEEIDPNTLKQFSHIGDIIGNASMNIAVDVILNNGENRILSLLRPNAERKAKYGFERMMLTAQDNKYNDNEYSTIINDLVHSAQERIGLEANCYMAPEQYAKAIEMYDGKTISINGKQFISSAAEVQEAGSNFYIMNKIEGQHFSELPEDTEEQIQFKMDCAKAILTLELSHILNGQFDADRHGGQMKIVQNGSDVFIGHFDFKGMRLDKWQERDYQQLAEILYVTVLHNLSSQSDNKSANISQTFSTQSFIEAENEIIKRGEKISPLISEVRKALLSLNEYFNLLDDKEIAEVAFSALLSGRLSPDLVNSITDNIVNGIYSSSLTDKYPILKLTPKGIIKTLVKNTLQGGNLPNELKGMLQLPDDFELIKIK